jgi:hypothetical protein
VRKILELQFISSVDVAQGIFNEYCESGKNADNQWQQRNT